MGVQQGAVTTTAVVINMENLAAPISVTVIPGSGNTSKCEISTTRQASESPGSANWQSWTPGTVSAITTLFLQGKVTALRFTRVTGSSADQYEVVT